MFSDKYDELYNSLWNDADLFQTIKLSKWCGIKIVVTIM